MLLTSAAIAIGRKVKEERAKKKEAKQGLLNIGDSDVARKAFAHQLPKTIKDGKAEEGGVGRGVQRSGTDIMFESPTDVNGASMTLNSPAESSPGITSPQAQWHETNRASTPQPDVASPVRSEKASLVITSPATDHPEGTRSRAQSTRSSMPPPAYSPRVEDNSTLSPTSVYSRDSDTATLAASISDTASTLTNNPNAIKVRTNGSDLKSGFPYHPALFDASVHPAKWETFTNQIVETTKFSGKDHAQMWAAATATAMTGAFITSVVVGRSMNRKIQQKKVIAGLQDTSDGGLGDTLQQWNESYFRERGLLVHLELSESASKRAEEKSNKPRKPLSFYAKDDRDRKREERKFVIVVTKLEDMEGATARAMDAVPEIHEAPAEGGSGIPEMPANDDAKFEVAELPGDGGVMPVELPAMELPACVSLGYGSEKLEPPAGYAELESDTTMLLDKTTLKDEKDFEDFNNGVRPAPLMVTGSTHEALYKETT